MTEPIIGLVRLRANHPDLERVRRALAELVKHTVAESGCVFFHVHEFEHARGEFVLLERFVDERALELHMSADHTRRYFEGDHTKALGNEALRDLG